MKTKLFLTTLLILGAVGCASQPLRLNAPKQKNYEVLGQGQGGATGLMLFNFIPIGQNERFVRAYNEAVRSKGGDDLINPIITENWFWAYILNGYSTKIEGTVIKYK